MSWYWIVLIVIGYILIGGFAVVFLEKQDSTWFNTRPVVLLLWPCIVMAFLFLGIVQGSVWIAEHFMDWVFGNYKKVK